MLSSYTRASSLALFALFSAVTILRCEATTSTTFLSTSKTTPHHNEIGSDPGVRTTVINATSPDCQVESRTWCPRDQSCYVTTDGFKCEKWTTTGWVIIPDLHIFFARPPENQTAPTSGACTLLPLPTNTTLQDLLVLGIKRYDAYYRTSTILISDNATSILAGYSNCIDVQQRCADQQCVPVIPLGEVCEGNSECFNPRLNDTQTRGPICGYLPGKLEESPRCVNYIEVPEHNDNDTSPLHGGHRRSHIWIYTVAVLLLGILMISLFMSWKSRQSRRIGPTILNQSFEEAIAPLAEGPIGDGRRLSSAAGLMHEKDMELDQAFLNRIGHRSGTVHRTERLWGNNTVVVQPPLVGPGLRSANEDRVNNGFDIADVSPPAPTLEPAHEHPVVTFAPIKPSTDSPK